MNKNDEPTATEISAQQTKKKLGRSSSGSITSAAERNGSANARAEQRRKKVALR